MCAPASTTRKITGMPGQGARMGRAVGRAFDLRARNKEQDVSARKFFFADEFHLMDTLLCGNPTS